MKRAWDDGELTVSVEVWVFGRCRLVAGSRHRFAGESAGYLEHAGALCIDHHADAIAACRAVIAGEMSPAILADWIEDYRHLWGDPGPVRDAAAEMICWRLRAFDHVEGEVSQ
jgi:hypothetical protein